MDNSLTIWLHKLKSGEASEAEQRLWDEYFERLVKLARSKMRDVPQAWHDEEDIALSAMKSFFARAKNDQFPNLNESSDLWPLLATITLRKVINARRHHLAEKRDARRNLPLDSSTPKSLSADEFLQTTNELLETLDSDQLRTITRLKMSGYSNMEIASEIGRSHKTVEWKLKLIREQLLQALQSEEDNDAESADD